MMQNNKTPEPVEHKITQHKKPWLLWRILRWMGLGILTLLLAINIIFQISWKVIIILATILACCTILPRRFRKWFWLSVGVIIIALIIWGFLPEDNEGWQPYTFDDELAAIEAKYAVPDEENAALIYDKIFEGPDIDSNAPEFFIKSEPSSNDDPWLSKDHPEMAEWLKSHQKTIETLLQATKKDKCIFLPIITGPIIPEYHMSRTTRIHECAFLLVSAANNDMAEGRTDASLEKLFCIIQMARHMKQQPVMIHQLVGISIERLSLQQLNRFVIEDQPNEEQLQLISNSKTNIKSHWRDDCRKTIDIDKLCMKNMICGMFYEKNSEGKVRFSRNPLAQWNKHYPQQFTSLTTQQRSCSRIRAKLSWLYYPSKPEKVAKAIDENFKKLYAMAEPDFDWSGEPEQPRMYWKFNYRTFGKLFTDMLIPSYYKIHENYLKNLALRRGSRLLIAIKQYEIENNNWPESLDGIKSKAPAEAFIDPISGNEFEYENHGKTFSLFGEKTNIWPK